MDDDKQFETMAAIRAYAQAIATSAPQDIRPSVAKYDYARRIERMTALCKILETRS